jgi:hypothetical protein
MNGIPFIRTNKNLRIKIQFTTSQSCKTAVSRTSPSNPNSWKKSSITSKTYTLLPPKSYVSTSTPPSNTSPKSIRTININKRIKLSIFQPEAIKNSSSVHPIPALPILT